MSSNHSHISSHDFRHSSAGRMKLVLGLSSFYMIIQVVVGLTSGSLALLADAGHMLTDIGSMMLSLLAFWFSSKPSSEAKTYGYYRSEILAGLINGMVLVGMSLFIFYESWQRLFQPQEVHGVPVLAVALLGLVINLTSMKLLGHHASDSLNVKAVYLEVFSDMLATFGVIVASLLVIFFKWYIADPIVSFAIGLMILPRTWGLLSECIHILMEGVPGHIDLLALRQALLKVSGVVDIHDIHVWSITSGLDAMSAHVIIENSSSAEIVLHKITNIVQGEFGIHHSTVQVEQQNCNGKCD